MAHEFKASKTLSDRQGICKRLLRDHPDCAPVIVSEAGGSGLVLSKRKYLIKLTANLSDLLVAIRKRANIGKEDALFLSCGGTIPKLTELMSELYKHKEEDGFLYIEVHREATFGGPCSGLACP